jgi:phosphatidylserine decarboxylase
VLHFGEIRGEQVEQVKGITYSLTALLGTEDSATSTTEINPERSHAQIVDDKNFAHINDIPYSLSKLLGKGTEGTSVRSGDDSTLPKTPMEQEVDASHPPSNADFAHDVSVAMELGTGAVSPATDRSGEIPRLSADHKLFFLVVYLAPGDYHRFHSPATWVVERRRHFTGDLFSVSPYIANRLKNLFVLNERVALLGRWKYGFFSMVPVGATNVGSIRINFDETLRTNTHDGNSTKEPHSFSEATYSSASLLRGQPLLTGEEMGGFRLGSTIVMVFEAPKDWKFTVKAGETIKMGESLGHFAGEGEGGVGVKKVGGGIHVNVGKKA